MKKRALLLALLGFVLMAPVTGGGPGGTPQTDCDVALNDKVLYDTATGLWSCGVDQGGGAAFGFGTIGNAVADLGGDTLVVNDSTTIDFTTVNAATDTFTGIVSMVTNRLLGRTTGGTGEAETITVNSPLTFTGLALDITNIGDADIANSPDYMLQTVYDPVSPGDGQVDYAQLADYAANLDSDLDQIQELSCSDAGDSCSFDVDEDGVEDFGIYFGQIIYTGRFLSTQNLGIGATVNAGACLFRTAANDRLFEDKDCDSAAIEATPLPAGNTTSEAFLTDFQRRLATTFTTATTAATPCTSALCQVTGLKIDLDYVGAYVIEYNLLTQSTVATTGMSFGVEYTGTKTSLYCVRNYPSTAANTVDATGLTINSPVATGMVDDVSAVNTGQLVEHMAANVASTLVPNLGPTAGVATVDSTALETITCNLLTTGAGDLQLWMAAETAVTVRLMANSTVSAQAFP